ncbi:hypothetical protein ASG87_03985 [Frateuria sp. Soil773]|uniref:hypothetical protein n=1 Tax=Frateuria sp. Soil773 TaxID=1736407 RepID=UPI000700A09F|nr:hypothetical protein [Frateuria sp. Soil773]KRE89496.1 hypothetical protein ASG87_03985 [Frateuria sp. Soil773]
MQSTSTPSRRATLVFGTMSLAALLAANTACAAQAQSATMPAQPVAATGLPPPPPPPADAPEPPLPGAVPAPLPDQGAPVTTQVAVSRFVTNPDGDVDGFLASDGTLVHFPPHMGAQLTAAVRPGDSVQLNGWRDAAGNVQAQRIVDTRSGQQLIDQPPLPDAQPMPPELRGARLSLLNVQGQVARVTTAPRGEPDGVILVDGTVIKLAPPVAQQFTGLLHAGATVSAQGYGTRNPYGTALQATAFGAPGNLRRLYDSVPPTP